MSRVVRKPRRSLLLAGGLASLCVLGVLALPSRNGGPPERAVLVTLASVGGEGDVLVRLPLDPARQDEVRTVLEGFEILGSPRISFDGRRAVFSGRRSGSRQSRPREIWEVDVVAGSGPRRVATGTRGGVAAGGDLLDPCYFPGDTVVYARSAAGSGETSGSSLFVSSLDRDSEDERRITFGAAGDRSPELLPDGCVVFRRGGRAQRPRRLMAVRTDGTGLELFCEPAPGASIVAGPWVVGNEVIFVEEPLDAGDRAPGAGRLVAVPASQPLGDRRVLATAESLGGAGSSGTVTSVAPVVGGRLLLSVAADRRDGTLLELGPPSSGEGRLALSKFELQSVAGGHRPTAVAALAPRQPPLVLTSVVDESKSTGTLFCIDIHSSRLPALERLGREAALTVRVLTEDGQVSAETAVAPDGSFAVEVPADRPLRLELHGADGLIAEDESGFWVRPNESRACVGCHEDPELAPENRVLGAFGRAESPAASLRLAESREGA